MSTTTPSLPQLVQSRASEHPDRIASVCGVEQLDYADLVRRVRVLAATLRADHGIVPGVMVPLLLRRDLDMSVAILAIMVAGGVCVPLDPSHPEARLRFMLEDCGAEVVLTNVDAASEIAGGRRVIDLRRPEVWTSEPMPIGDCPDEQAVYCLYTSGSTGQPKGVLLKQGGIRNVLLWARDYWRLTESDVLLHKSTFTFDISIIEQFLPLIAGARMLVLEAGAERDPAAVRQAIVDHGATIVQFTPSGLATYLATVGEDPMPGVTRCLAAGEPLKPALRDTFFTAVAGCGLYNLYGPTETTIYATAADVPAAGAITVGAPLPNTTLRILDDAGHELPDGEVGEIWIGGAGVAAGYLARPELTEDRFLTDPFSPGRQHYRTGDLGCKRPDGEIDVRGRSDYQVKIRGYRIELGEIEKALAAIEGVRDAVVTDLEINGARELVGYWIGEATARELAVGLHRTLPNYMVPSRFVRMQTFPLTSSGKVHRAGLPGPGPEAESGRNYVPPQDALGAGLCGILQDVLGWSRVGLEDRFLDLGGDSLKAVRVASQVNQRLRHRVEVDTILSNPTVGELLGALTEDSRERGIIPAAPPSEWKALSSGQRGLWLLEQVGAVHAAYTEPLIFRARGRLDLDALRQALGLLLARHGSLRTAIEQVRGGARQRAVPDVGPVFEVETITDEGEVQQRLARFLVTDFDLARGRLLHTLVLEKGPDEHVIALAMHHIATDGWSLSVMVDELITAYNAFRTGAEPEMAPLRIQYADFAHWQQAQLEDAPDAAAAQYWKEKLAGVTRLELPADRPHAGARSYRGATARRTLPSTGMDALRELCASEGCTVYAGLCAAVRVLFFRYTGQRDFALGTSTLGRPVAELETQLGYYVNSVALRDAVDQGVTFRAMLRAAQGTLLEALRFGDYPFDRVVADSGASTDLDRNAFFDVMVMMDPGWGDPTVAPEGLTLDRLDAPNAHSKLDLTLFFQETGDGLRLSVEYSTDIFDAERIERLIDHVETMLRAVCVTPDAAVEQLQLIAESERRRVLVDFNDTAVEWGDEVTALDAFDRQVRRIPDRVAVVDEAASLTYAQLNARADAVATVLRRDYHVGRGELVALRMDRSVHLCAAIFGVLKAGAAYLPIPTTDPADRVAAVLDDSAARVVLTDDVLATAALAGGRSVVDVTGQLPAAEVPVDIALAPEDLAYCIYTSGSTGVPNGVLVEHRSLVNRLAWTARDLGLDEDDVFLQKTPYNFDVSVWELLLPGVLGATQVMLRPGGEADPEVIREAIRKHSVSIVHFVPSMLERYLQAVEDGFAGVQHCVCSGEALGENLANRFLAAVRPSTGGGGTRLHNYYGPTEATIDVTAVEIVGGAPVTIGRPVANTRAYVLDECDQPVPIGIPGHLCVGGVQVARGYRNRPELTQQRFVADPFRPGDRLYRTGDIAAWQPDGQLRYLGRGDAQVKLRGFRIELGEVESALLAADAVEAAAVLLQHDAAAGDYLCAYVAGSAVPSPETLRAAVQRKLPAYMTPTRFIALASMPVTGNGKLDRAALAALAREHTVDTGQVAAGSQVERRLLDIWRGLLPAGSAVGVNDDFFLVGGHSLTALQLSARIEEAFGVPIGLAAVLRNRTVVAQAELLSAGIVDDGDVFQLRRRTDGEDYPLSYAQERLWFLHMLEPESGSYHITVQASLNGSLDVAALREAVSDAFERHEALRTTFVATEAGPRQRVRRDLSLPFEVREISGTTVAARRDVYRKEAQRIAQRPFAVSDESLLRVVLFHTGEDEHQLLVVVHHLASDGWSMRVLLDDISTRYAARTGEPVNELAPLPLQYADYAESVRDEANRRAVEADLDYWADRLTDVPPLTLAEDPDPDSAGTASTLTSLRLPDATVTAARALAASSGATQFEITMAALTVLLSRLADQQDIVIGFPVVNRRHVALERVVGLFLDTLALRTDVRGDPSFVEVLHRVSSGLREAYEHQQAPFELIVERINPPRRLDRTPIFQVLLNYQDDARERLEFGDVNVTVDNQHLNVEAKFALVFYVLVDEDGVRIDLAHRPDLFSAARAEAMMGQLAVLLRQLTAVPESKVAAVALTQPGADTLARALDHHPQPLVSDLIRQHVEQHPDAPAVVQGSAHISYADLLARSEALASRLIANGAAPGDIVAVTGPRGVGFVVSLLAVLRSGATVFPLDPGLPDGRRQHLLDAARPVRVVSCGRAPGGLGEVPIETVDPRTGELADRGAGTGVELPVIDDAVPAYLFFTSGTTGAPRGVLGRHSGLSHFLTWQRDTFGVSSRDRCAQTTSASFDVMLRDTLLALVSGGTVVVPEPADEAGGRALFSWIEQAGITVLHATPTVLRSWLLDAAPGIRLASLRLLFFAGEPLKSSLVETIRSTYPDVGEMVNLYGPTETTLAKLAYPVPHEPLPTVLPVGRAMPGCDALVMRGELVCGVGEPGEIILRTPYRSHGYLDGSPFLPNPRLVEGGDDLVYRTGDLGRTRPDGVIEILGRRDHQVKINGVRIQPVEVESVLAQHPLISTALVTAVPDARSETQLVGYVVLAGGATPGAELVATLRTYLSGLLPRAMVPSRFMVLDRVPTTPNGKIDRAALPRPSFEHNAPPPPRQRPATPEQRAVAEIWTEVLDGAQPGIDDNFFDLGGTSLKVLRLYTLLDARYPRTVRIAQLFGSPTVAGQADLVAGVRAGVRDDAPQEVDIEF